MSVKLDTRYLSKFIKPFELDQISPFVKTAHDILYSTYERHYSHILEKAQEASLQDGLIYLKTMINLSLKK